MPEKPAAAEYDPHDHRQVTRPLTNLESSFHILKGVLGTGITALPESIKDAGMILGTIGLPVVGAISAYSMHILIKAQYSLCKRLQLPFLLYRDSMYFGIKEGPNWFRPAAKPFAIITDICLVVNSFGTVSVYQLYCAANIKKVVDEYVSKEEEIHFRIWLVIFYVPLLAIMMIRHLKYLVPISQAANVGLAAGICVLFYFIFDKIPSPGERPLTGQGLDGIRLFIGKVIFAFVAPGVIVNVESEMKKPKSFGAPLGVLNISLFLMTVLYTFFGFVGYVKYGEDLVGGTITLRLPDKNILGNVLNCLLGLSVLLSGPLMAYTGFEILLKKYFKDLFDKSGHPLVCEYFLRWIMITLTTAAAVAVPRLDLYIALIGALILSLVGICFPALLDICVRWGGEEPPDRHPLFYVYLIRNIILIIIGLLGLGFGATEALEQIIRHGQEGVK